jgi:hypothetical protein
MKITASCVWKVGLLGVLVMLGAWMGKGGGGQVTVVKTNWTERWITNEIEVRMPQNRFVNEYRTNWVERVRTNRVTRYETNQVVRTRTNVAWVDLIRTNYVQAWQTNVKTLNVTNWTTVLVIKTNWVAQPLTNLVEMDLPGRAPGAREETGAAREVAAPRAAAWQAGVPAPSTRVADGLSLEASRTARPPRGNLVEVRLAVRRVAGAVSPVQVQRWKVESEDGAILCFGQDQEFKRELPSGSYKVEATVGSEKNKLLVRVLGTLVVTTRDATMQQSLAAAK